MPEQKHIDTMERGNIYFAYRPKVEEEAPERLEDVQRFYMVLSPHGKQRYRLIVIGQKRLPDVEDGGDKYWGFVEKVGQRAEEIRDELTAETYRTKTRGERHQPAARPAGEGVYALVRHEDHTHLVYELELPRDIGEVQQAFNIREEASYIVSVKNPESSSPRGAGLPDHDEADFPRRMQERFAERRFVDVDPPEFMDYEGAELLFIAAGEDVSQELGVHLNAQEEEESTAEVFNDLRLRKTEHPPEPLLKGEWA